MSTKLFTMSMIVAIAEATATHSNMATASKACSVGDIAQVINSDDTDFIGQKGSISNLVLSCSGCSGRCFRVENFRGNFPNSLFCVEDLLCGQAIPTPPTPTPCFQCPANSYNAGSNICCSTFADCMCNYGFDKQGSQCVRNNVAVADRQCSVGDIAQVINVDQDRHQQYIGQKGTIIRSVSVCVKVNGQKCDGGCFKVDSFRGFAPAFFCSEDLLCGNVIKPTSSELAQTAASMADQLLFSNLNSGNSDTPSEADQIAQIKQQLVQANSQPPAVVPAAVRTSGGSAGSSSQYRSLRTLRSLSGSGAVRADVQTENSQPLAINSAVEIVRGSFKGRTGIVKSGVLTVEQCQQKSSSRNCWYGGCQQVLIDAVGVNSFQATALPNFPRVCVEDMVCNNVGGCGN